MKTSQEELQHQEQMAKVSNGLTMLEFEKANTEISLMSALAAFGDKTPEDYDPTEALTEINAYVTRIERLNNMIRVSKIIVSSELEG